MPAVHMSTSLRVFWRVHRTFMRLTGGRFGKVGPIDALLLTTKGRKTGERRDVALNYIRDGDSHVVVASYAGEDRDPAWWRNLRANPRMTPPTPNTSNARHGAFPSWYSNQWLRSAPATAGTAPGRTHRPRLRDRSHPGTATRR